MLGTGFFFCLSIAKEICGALPYVDDARFKRRSVLENYSYSV